MSLAKVWERGHPHLLRESSGFIPNGVDLSCTAAVWHWLASVFERYQLARCTRLTSIEEG